MKIRFLARVPGHERILLSLTNKCFIQTWVTHFSIENLQTLIESEGRGLGLKLPMLIRIMTSPLCQAITSLELAN